MYFSPMHSPKAQREAPDQTPLKPVGTGPYKFVEWVKGQYIKLEANPDWWGHTATDARGAATIKDLTFVFRAEREVRTAMVQRERGGCRPLGQPGPVQERTPVQGRPDRRDHPAAAGHDESGPGRQADPRGDRAGGRQRRHHERHPGRWRARRAAESGRRCSASTRPCKPYPYDPARAKQLVAEAKAAGVPVDTTPLTLIVRRAAYFRIEEAAEAITDMLQQAGLTTIKPQVLETAKFTELYTRRPSRSRPSVASSRSTATATSCWTSPRRCSFYFICEGRTSTYCDPELAEMQKNALPLSGDARVKAYQAIAQKVHDDFVVVPIGAPSFWYAISQRLDWTPRPDGFILGKEMKLKE